MPSKNTTRKRSHLQPVPDKPVELAKSAADWRKLEAKIETAVGVICQHYDAETTQALLFVIDLLTNSDYDRQDRDLATHQVTRAAFRYTPEFESAQNEYLDRLSLAKRRVSA